MSLVLSCVVLTITDVGIHCLAKSIVVSVLKQPPLFFFFFFLNLVYQSNY